mmetsp:Transcript_54239/g.142862  ORF Transcript_54239/g.142862 Transcript_54239/m.142862 type:complete len:304 (-) Transcript_54239:58-969(-)
MIDTVSGCVGFLEPLDTLQEQYSGSDVHRQKISDFASEFGAWRRCRGDGNCFFRAYGFALVESLLRGGPSSLRPVLDQLRASAAGEAEAFLNAAQPLCDLPPEVALERWYRTLFMSEEIDSQLVRAIRMVSAEYLTNNEEADFNGLPLNVYVEASHGLSLEAFRASEVLANGVEAESVTLTLAPMALGLKIEIIQLDKSDSVQRYMVPDGAPGDVMATLLFKPGHYDIFYRKDAGEALLALQAKGSLLRECKRKVMCPICMDEVDCEPPERCGCFYHAECLQAYQASGSTCCAVCKAELVATI